MMHAAADHALPSFAAEHDPRAAERELGDFLFAHAFDALQGMGVFQVPGLRYQRGALTASLRVAPKYVRYIDALLARLARRGWLQMDDDTVVTSAGIPARLGGDPGARLADFEAAFVARHPHSAAAMRLAARTMAHYGDILVGALGITEVLFPDGDMALFAAMSGAEPVPAYFNQVAASAIAAVAATAPGAHPCILEIGAGAGSTTAVVLDTLACGRAVKYCFSDISPAFIRHAQRRFSTTFGWLGYAVLDIEDAAAVGRHGTHSYDLVYAGNVLHDTRDIAHTLAQVRHLLKPGGSLVLNEYTEAKDWLFFTGALLHGPWLYQDPERRVDGFCLLSVAQWRSALAEAGFLDVRAVTLPTQAEEDCGQAVLICTAPAVELSAESAPPPVLQPQPVPAVPAASVAPALAPALDLVAQVVLALLGTDRTAAYHPDRPLMEQGLDSVELVELKGLLGARYGIALPAALMFVHETPRKLARALAELAGAAAGAPAAPALRPTSAAHGSIAVVGMACRLPGGVASPEAFWHLLEQGGHGIGVMDRRWEWPAFIDLAGRHAGIDKGGFLDRIDEFDAAFFRIAPREAELMDPQQRLLLELGWEAIEDAGYRAGALAGTPTGVFVGACHGDYRDLMAPGLDRPEAYVASGTSPALLANRLSYFFDLNGPSLTTDTACSAALVALDNAVQSIRRGACSQALVGAVNLICSPTNSIAYHAAGMLSSTAACHTFDVAADGYVRGEGAVMLLLKPLEQALADGDAIYGCVRGSAVGHGGQANSLTAPKPDAQAATIARALADAGTPAASIRYVEAHGTGTRLGDPIEVAGLVMAFGPGRAARPYCGLGSVKTNLGHLEGAAGLAGVAKVLLGMTHRALPPSRNFRTLNPHIAMQGTPFYVTEYKEVWTLLEDGAGGHWPRRAGVSSFGFGGANAHAVLEEAPVRSHPAPAGGRCLVPLSARSGAALLRMAERLRAACTGRADCDLADLAYTLQAGREAMAERVAFVVDGMADLDAALARFVAGAPALRTAARSAIDHMDSATEVQCWRDGELDVLARHWVAGGEIDWERLHAGAGRQRLRLPVYPFERQRHWLPAPAVAATVPASSSLMWARRWQVQAARPEFPALRERRVLLLVAPPEASRGIAALLAGAVECHVLALQGDDAGGSFVDLATQALACLQRAADADGGPVLLQLLVCVPAVQALGAGLAGMLRSAQLEYPHLRAQLIEIDQPAAPTDLVNFLQENARTRAAEVRYRGGVRQLPGWDERAISTIGTAWRDGGVYVISGGAGGLGLLFAAAIARAATQPVIALLGRSPAAPALQAQLQALRVLGAQSSYHQVDVTDAAALEAVLALIHGRHGAVHGIIHAAGVLRDQLLPNKRGADLSAVLAPKVAGLVNLDLASANLALDFMLLCSSTAAVFGNPGQTDYAAANDFMDRFAVQRNGLRAAGLRHGRTVSVNWPLWRDGGMQLDAAAAASMERRFGIRSLPTAAGLAALDSILAGDDEQVLVLYGAEALLRQLVGGTAPVLAGSAPVPVQPLPSGPELAAALAVIAAAVLKLPTALERDVAFASVGFDSISLTEFAQRLNAAYGLDLAPTVFYLHPTVAALAYYLAGNRPAPAPAVALAAEPTVSSARVAIIGMSGRFPGADDLDAWWENLLAGRTSISEVPTLRWDWRALHGDPTQPGRQTDIRWGGFIDGIDQFDPAFFQLSPREAQLMDPQQRLLMMEAWRAIEEAGYGSASLAGSRTGVFAAIGPSDYGQRLAAAGVAVESFSALGLMPSAAANRISHWLDLRGPSEAVDASCVSSLVAVQRAMAALRNGECDLALVAVCNLLLQPDLHVSLSKAGVLSQDGRCKSFSATADGYVRGEGVAAVLLKRADDAGRDGDHVHALLVAGATSHGGRASSLTAPNAQAQAALIGQLYRRAGVDPAALGYVEAHGTGTALGDPLEVEALQAAWRDCAVESVAVASCGLGSVKSNIGALEVAAGMAGLIKVVLQAKNATLVASVNCDPPNPYLKLEGSPFHVVRERQPWPARHSADGRALPRLAGVNAFNISGANAHLVVEEYFPALGLAAVVAEALVPLSAREGDGLRRQARRLAAWLRRAPAGTVALADLAYTLQSGRDPMAARMGCVATSLEQLADQLEAFALGRAAEGVLAPGGAAPSASAGARRLKAWVDGAAEDWSGACPGVPRRLGLPTYPFALQSCWVPGAAPTGLALDGRAGLRLQGGEAFLRDHRIGGVALLPAVAYLEMALQAIASTPLPNAVGPAWIRDVVWLQPLSCQHGPMDLTVALDPLPAGGYDFVVSAAPVDWPGTAQAFAQGRIGWSVAPPLAVVVAAPDPGVVLRSMDGPSCYVALAAAGFDYGPSQRAIVQLEISANQAQARLALPDGATLDGYQLHPALADAALQVMVAFSLDGAGDGMQPLPFELAGATFLAPCQPQMRAALRRSVEQGTDGTTWSFDVDLCHEDGTVAVALRGLAMRLVRTAGLVDAGAAKAQRAAANPPATMPALGGLPRAQAVATLLEQLRGYCAELLGLDRAALERAGRPFAQALLVEFGMDSLSSTALRNLLRHAHGAELRVQHIIGEPAGRLAELLYEQWLLGQVSGGPVLESDGAMETFEF